MDSHEAVHHILTVGKRYSIDVREMSVLLQKLIVLSVKFVSKRILWSARFGEDYVHWELVEGLANKNICGGCAEWIGLLSFCKWDDLGKLESTIQSAHQPLQVLRHHMRECCLDTGGTDAWTLTCKLFLLMLVQGLPSLHVLEMITCGIFKRNTHIGCMELLAKQAGHLFTPGQYESTLQFVLDKCVMDTRALEQTLALSRASMEDRKLSLKMSRMTVVVGRPRLRDRVSSVLRTEERKAQVDSLLETWESYTGFTYKHQFPPTLSEKVKSRLYFLASQTRWDWGKYVEIVMPSGGPLLGKVMAHPITQPDLPVILRVIEGLSMDGSPPFVQMTSFRTACFQSFPVTHVQRMTLSQILQLYVAAYQAPAIWKEAWKHLVGVISVQIIRDVETFVSKTPFADADVMRFVVVC